MSAKLRRIDYVGNILLVAATVSVLYAMTYGGNVEKVVALEVQVLPHGHDSGVLPAVRYVYHFVHQGSPTAAPCDWHVLGSQDPRRGTGGSWIPHPARHNGGLQSNM